MPPATTFINIPLSRRRQPINWPTSTSSHFESSPSSLPDCLDTSIDLEFQAASLSHQRFQHNQIQQKYLQQNQHHSHSSAYRSGLYSEYIRPQTLVEQVRKKYKSVLKSVRNIRKKVIVATLGKGGFKQKTDETNHTDVRKTVDIHNVHVDGSMKNNQQKTIQKEQHQRYSENTDVLTTREQDGETMHDYSNVHARNGERSGTHGDASESLVYERTVKQTSMFRSEDMQYVRIIANEETAYDTVKELGNFANFHVVDLAAGGGGIDAQSERQLNYKKRIAACVFYEKKLLAFYQAFKQFHVALPPHTIKPRERRHGDIVEDLRQFIEPFEEQFAQNAYFKRDTLQNINSELEKLHIFNFLLEQHTGSSLEITAQPSYGSLDENSPLLAADDHERATALLYAQQTLEEGSLRNKITTITNGVMPAERVVSFERMLFRTSRGNAVFKFKNIPEPFIDPVTDEPVNKVVFSVYYLGEALQRRVEKLSENVGATIHDVGTENFASKARECSQRLNEARAILERTEQEIQHLLSNFSYQPSECASAWADWLHGIRHEIAICDVLRKCSGESEGSKLMTLEGWIPTDELQNLRVSVHLAVRESRARPAAIQVLVQQHAPPTYFHMNKFTEAYQAIVDTYGVPKYKEVNPGLFTVVSFPFLFGVMYGDIGHGTLLFLFSLMLVLREKQIGAAVKRGDVGEIPRMAFGGRYMLLLMGAFAMYCGFIYNDCFSIPWNLFGSHWHFHNGVGSSSGGIYPFGVDPGWYHATNSLAFFNSMKMKFSVIIGVIQMCFGIMLSLCNDIYFGNRSAVLFEFVPRMAFMLCTFGYMVFIVVFKLCCDWSNSDIQPPPLVQTMISMFLSPGHVAPEMQLYSGQGYVQLLLLLIALVSVPVMLFGGPIVTRREWRKNFSSLTKSDGSFDSELPTDIDLEDNSYQEYEDEDDMSNSTALLVRRRDVNHTKSSKHSVHEKLEKAPAVESVDEHAAFEPTNPHYSFSDHLITNGIHTIEYVLGSVSNTASYLRLWALSLAHAELSEVFFSRMIMQYGLETGSPIMIVFGFGAWAGATFGVLLAMDVLECFLHALRLHWVEFQNKFYSASGYAFEPFVLSPELVLPDVSAA